MTKSRKLQALSSVSAIALLGFVGSASAETITVLSFTASGSTTPVSPATGTFPLLNLGTDTAGTNKLQSSSTINPGQGVASISFNASSNPASGLYAGNPSGDTSPFGTANGSTVYLSAGGVNSGTAGSVTVVFSSPQTSLYVLWGTVDFETSGSGVPPDRNAITFSGDGSTPLTIDGSNVHSADSSLSSGADNAYVEITGLSPFLTATFTDDKTSAFEFQLGIPTATPLPAALPLFAGGLGAMGLLSRRKKRKAVAAA